MFVIERTHSGKNHRNKICIFKSYVDVCDWTDTF